MNSGPVVLDLFALTRLVAPISGALESRSRAIGDIHLDVMETLDYLGRMLGQYPDNLSVRKLEELDIESLVECVRRCYGESYPEADFYDATSIRRQLNEDRLISGVAVTRSGRVIGHIGTRIPIPGDAVGESMGAFIDPDYRNLGLLRRIGHVIASGYREHRLVGARHIATGAHDRTQRTIVASGGVATGVLLANIPAETDYRAIEHDFGPARIGSVVYHQSFSELPSLTIYTSQRYADQIASLRNAVGLERTIRWGTVPAGEPFAAAVCHDSVRGVSTFRFGTIAWEGGEDTDVLLARELNHCGPVTYADVPLADARAASQIESLCGQGFFFGAWLPGTADSESLRLQRIEGTLVAPDKIIVSSTGGADLLDWIANVDRQSARRVR